MNLSAIIFFLLMTLYPTFVWGAGKGWSSIFVLGQGAKAANAISKAGKPTSINAAPSYSKVYDQSTLTPEQLLFCLKAEQEIGNSQTKLDDNKERLTEVNTKVQRMSADISQLKFELTTDQYRAQLSAALADAYNEKVDAYNNQVRGYREAVSSANLHKSEYNNSVDLHNRSVAKFKASCAGKTYYDEDLRSALNLVR